MHDPRAFVIKLIQRFGENPGQTRVENSDQLPRWSRRIQKRAKQIENCPLIFSSEPLAHFSKLSERRMITARKNESQPITLQTFLQLLGREIDRNPELLENVGASLTRGYPAIAMLRHDRATGRSHEHGRR